MTRTIFAAVLFALAAASPALAQFTYARHVYAATDTAYVFRGAQRADLTATLNGEVELNGIYAGFLAALPFGDDADGAPLETRFYGAWSPHIEDRGSKIDFEIGLTYFAFHDEPPGMSQDDRVEPHVGVMFDAPFDPRVFVYYDVEGETLTLEGGLARYYELQGLRGLQLTFDGGYVAPDRLMDYAYAEAGVEFIQGFSHGVEAFVGLRGAVSSEETFFSDLNAAGPVFGEKAKGWVTVGVSATF